jgi:succinate dehydrogenase/fumarate reductase flavoprotein subunit
MSSGNFDFDVIVIGSGFGGCVAALRATEKGHRVGSRRKEPSAVNGSRKQHP